MTDKKEVDLFEDHGDRMLGFAILWLLTLAAFLLGFWIRGCMR
jgi:hypothetical protein